jgi:hypothetical protein
MKKSSAQLNEILSNMDEDIISKSKDLVSSVVGSFEEQLLKSPLTFKVGDYEVLVEAKSGSLSGGDLDIYLSCSCSYWQYQGPEYHAKQNGYLLGKARGTAEKPIKKDPNGTHKLCKHAYVVLKDYFGA